MGFFAISAQHIWLNLQFCPVVFFILAIIFILVSNAEKLGLESPPARKYKDFKKISSLILFPSFFLCPCLPPTFLASLLPCFHPTSHSSPTPSLSYFLPGRSLLWLPLILSFPPSWPNSSLPSSLHLLLRFSFFSSFLSSYFLTFLSPTLPPLSPSFIPSFPPFKRPSIPPSPPLFYLSFLGIVDLYLIAFFFADQGYRYVHVTWAWWVNRVSKIASTR